MKRLETRLRERRREEARPTPVYVFYDSVTMTRDDAVEAAYRSGLIPPNAVLFIAPEPIPDHEAWSRLCQAEYAAREQQRREQQQQPAGDGPA